MKVFSESKVGKKLGGGSDGTRVKLMSDQNGGKLKWKRKGSTPGERRSFRPDQESGPRQGLSCSSITRANPRTLLPILARSSQPQIRRRAAVARGNAGNYGHK